ncbi:MAG TPA: phosphoribosylanthranilate isomerase [Armatimonadota bacterium]
MVRVKVCGITRLEDARAAADAGADALGFIFAPSPRQVDPELVRRICEELPPFVDRVGVFVDAHKTPELLEECAPFLTAFQFHGNEPLEWLAECRLRHRIRVLRVRNAEDLLPGELGPGLAAWEAVSEAILLDARSERGLGGTGESFDWHSLRQATFRKPVILAGGLGPENVREALQAVRPYGVDASSSLETSPGRKDAHEVKAFIQAVRDAESAFHW